MKKLEKDTDEEEEIMAVRPKCRMRVCENPKTGEIEILYSPNCPKGYIERYAGKIATKGVVFAKDTEEEKEK
jgi:hypothetical protein